MKYKAAVSCIPDPYRLGGVGFGFGPTGKLGRAWVDKANALTVLPY